MKIISAHREDFVGMNPRECSHIIGIKARGIDHVLRSDRSATRFQKIFVSNARDSHKRRLKHNFGTHLLGRSEKRAGQFHRIYNPRFWAIECSNARGLRFNGGDFVRRDPLNARCPRIIGILEEASE